ncbi:unnamed protein product [Ilex paraguariensis]|uniref:Exostosin GT47 domain-containing protein n=1 Tax=Ilex paraguariensis TaxID=185542 RepID=A0ABC8RR71_9AQUA
MGHDLRYTCQMETRRLLWLVGVVFAIVLTIQYFELPNVFSSLFSAGETQILVLETSATGNSSLSPQISGNLKILNSSNSDFTTAIHDTNNITNISEANGYTSERDGGSDESLVLDEDGDPEDESSSENVIEINNTSTVEKTDRNNSPAPEKARESDYTSNRNSSLGSIQKEHLPFASEENGNLDSNPAIPSFGSSPIISPSPLSPQNVATNSGIPAISSNPKISSVDKGAVVRTNIPAGKERSERPLAEVMSVSEMYDLLRQSRASSRSMRLRWSSAVDQELLVAKSQIENAPIIRNHGLYAPLYRNVSMFKRSYELMEQTLKVYIYKEGERPIFHQPVLKGIYASEGWFMKLMKASKHFVTKNPKKAHLFYFPFSSRMLEETLYVPNSHNRKNLVQHLKNYLDMIVARYSFWNRTGGADHFLVACHDWAPSETRDHMPNCIRALCNTDIKEGFKLGKDVSLPETYVRSPQHLLRELGGKPRSERRILAFFAGSMHGYLRPILLQYWENKDPDMKIFGRMRKVRGQMTYVQHMKSSKYCICAKGYEVNSPRVVEAVFYECVPVIISDDFVPPFFEVLNWDSFAVFVLEKDIPNLKNILLSIPEKRYLQLQRSVKQVQQHFLWHARPVKYDVFHMILHSIWYNRVFQINPR